MLVTSKCMCVCVCVCVCVSHNFLLQYLEISSYSILQGCSVTSNSLRPHGLYSPGQNTGVDSLSLLQGIFPTQALNPSLLHCRRIIYQLSHKGNPYIYVYVYFFSYNIQSKFAYRIALLTSPCIYDIVPEPNMFSWNSWFFQNLNPPPPTHPTILSHKS